MDKIAIVVQRAGENIIGGSEDYAMRMAKILSFRYGVDIITTTAKTHLTWDNYYGEGIEPVSEKVRILRFKVNIGRTEYWHELSRLMLRILPPIMFNELSDSEKRKLIMKLPLGLQEEFIKFQGPYSEGLLEYLKKSNNMYDRFIFMTYLFPTTYFGVDMIYDKNKVFIVPTFHDEPQSYFTIFRKYTDYKLLFLTEAEMNLAKRIFGGSLKNFHIINFGLQDRYQNKGEKSEGLQDKYIIYAGRLEEGKGINTLIEYFERFLRDNPEQNLKLYLLGDGSMKTFLHPAIKYLGVVNENEKVKLFKNAVCFVHPSPLESLSITLIEAFMLALPAIVNRRSDVLLQHINDSGAGFSYSTYREFSEALLKILKDTGLRNSLKECARKYFLAKYHIDLYREKLINIIESING